MKLVLAIALGGAIGAVGRHFVAARMMHWLGPQFPWGTVTVNVVGSFVMGLLVESMALRWNVGTEMRGFLTVGILGAFTTFSTFSLDVALLSARGQMLAAALYIAVSVIASIAALFAGMAVMRALLS